MNDPAVQDSAVPALDVKPQDDQTKEVGNRGIHQMIWFETCIEFPMKHKESFYQNSFLANMEDLCRK